jgi:dihydrofolate reductase
VETTIIAAPRRQSGHAETPGQPRRLGRPRRRHRPRRRPAGAASGDLPRSSDDDGRAHRHGPQDLGFDPGRPLPGRRNIVVTAIRRGDAEGAERAASLEEALGLAGDVPRVFVLGGAEIFARALPLADELELTEIDAEFPADTFFPAWTAPISGRLRARRRRRRKASLPLRSYRRTTQGE